MLYEQPKRDGLFLSIKHGAICLESSEPKEGYDLITGEVDGRPYSKYIKRFAGMDGKITKIEWYSREGEYGSFRGLKIRIKDKGEVYFLDLPYGKRQYDYFTKVAENIDYSKLVEFHAWRDKQKPKQTVFALKQNDAWIQWKYTRDEMGDCPPAKHNERTGKWNFDDQREWLLERLLTVVAPACEAAHAFDEPEPEYSGVEEDEDAVAEREALMTDDDDPNNPLNRPPDVTQEPPPHLADHLANLDDVEPAF